MTLNELIAAAETAKNKSPLGGDTMVYLSEFEREPREIRRTFLDTDEEHPEDGAVFLVATYR